MQSIRIKHIAGIAFFLGLSGCGNSIPENKDLQRYFDGLVSENCKDYVHFSDAEKTNGYADGDKYRIEYKAKVKISPPKDWAEIEKKKNDLKIKYLSEIKDVATQDEAIDEVIQKYNSAVADFNRSNANGQAGLDQAKEEFKMVMSNAADSYLKVIKINEKYATELGVKAPKAPDTIDKATLDSPNSSVFRELKRAAQPLPDGAFLSVPPQTYLSCLSKIHAIGVLESTSERDPKQKRHEGEESQWNGTMLMRKTEQGWSPVED